MKEDLDQKGLFRYVGSNSPFWRLSADNNTLHLATGENAEASQTITLTDEQAEQVRAMTVITSSVTTTVPLLDREVTLHLVGRKIGKTEWAGTASSCNDTSSIAQDLVQGLSFAEQVVSEAHSAIVILDRHGNIQRFNRLCEEYTGLRETEVIGQNVFKLFMSRKEAVASRRNIANFFLSGSSYEVERWIKTRKGQRLFLFRNKFVHSGSGKNEIYLICSGTDITEERRAQERLRVLANTDTVTGLPNRNAINELTSDAIAKRGDTQVGIVYLDLDNFKKVNDAYGHMFGDQLLQAVALAILSCLDEGQVLARLGGDEFIVLATKTSQSALEAMASRILTRLRQPFRIGLIEVYSGCSLGFHWRPSTARTGRP